MVATRDWVVNAATWQGPDAVTLEYPYDFVRVGELGFTALTRQTDSGSIARVSIPEITNRMLAVEVRGHIHCHLNAISAGSAWDTQVFSTAYRLMAMARITRYPMEPDGQTIGTLDGYDLSNVISANDQYVWHRERQLINRPANEWNGTAGARVSWKWTWPVMARFKRTLEELECMGIFVQLESGISTVAHWDNPDMDVELRYNTRLRTFVHA